MGFRRVADDDYVTRLALFDRLRVDDVTQVTNAKYVLYEDPDDATAAFLLRPSAIMRATLIDSVHPDASEKTREAIRAVARGNLLPYTTEVLGGRSYEAATLRITRECPVYVDTGTGTLFNLLGTAIGDSSTTLAAEASVDVIPRASTLFEWWTSWCWRTVERRKTEFLDEWSSSPATTAYAWSGWHVSPRALLETLKRRGLGDEALYAKLRRHAVFLQPPEPPAPEDVTIYEQLRSGE